MKINNNKIIIYQQKIKYQIKELFIVKWNF